MSDEREYIVLRSAGMLPGQSLEISVARYVCGDVLDGIGMRIAGDRGGFVVSWEDFQRAYEANVEVRKHLPPPGNSIEELMRDGRIWSPKS